MNLFSVTKTSDQTRQRGVCVCVFFLFILDVISSLLDVPAGVTQEEGHTGFLIHLLSAVRALIFLGRRIQPFLSLVDREVEICEGHLLWASYLGYIGIGSGNLGTSNPIRLFYGVVFGRIR